MVNALAVYLRLPASPKSHPTFHVSWFKQVLESELVQPSCHPPPARMIDGGLAFSVQRILDVRGHRWKLMVYLRRIQSQGEVMVHRRYILDEDLLTNFYWDHPNQPGSVPTLELGGVHFGFGRLWIVFFFVFLFFSLENMVVPVLAYDTHLFGITISDTIQASGSCPPASDCFLL